MFFSGIEKISLNDFPGKIACTVFIQGCNFFCPYCHNPQSVPSYNKYALKESIVLEFLEERKKFYQGIVISGGEPTLNPKLLSFCYKLKRMKFEVKLDTNGSSPDILKRLLNENLIDYIAMDIKTFPSLNLYKQFTNEINIAKKIKQSIKLIMREAPKYEFRTTCVNPFINSKIIEQICFIIKGANSYTLQSYNKNVDSILNKNFFIKKNKDPVISEEKIFELSKIANSIIENCIINII